MIWAFFNPTFKRYDTPLYEIESSDMPFTRKGVPKYLQRLHAHDWMELIDILAPDTLLDHLYGTKKEARNLMSWWLVDKNARLK